MKLTFDTHGNEKQKSCCAAWLNKSVTDIVYGGSKGSAKSYTGVSLIFGDAFIYPGTHYFIARRRLNDIRKYTIPSVYEVFEHWHIKPSMFKYNGQDNYFELHNGSRVYLLEASYQPSDPLYYRFGSMQMTRGWIEEAGEVQEAAKNNLAASIGRWKNDIYNLTPKLLQTCNPSKNYLYRDYYMKHKQFTLESWKCFIQALPTDNKMLPSEYLESLRRTLSPSEKERLLNGNWEYDDDPAVMMEYESILNIFKNEHVPAGLEYITADIARLGKDTTRIYRWSGLRCVEIVTLVKKRVNEVADRIRQMANDHSIPMSRVVVDEDGVGGGVVDLLQCVGFVNNSGAINGENFDNLKSQCYFKLADLVNENMVYIACKETETVEAIIEELEQVKQKHVDSDLKKGVVPKEDVKEMLGRSPDHSDAIMMRMYFEIQPQSSYRARGF